MFGTLVQCTYICVVVLHNITKSKATVKIKINNYRKKGMQLSDMEYQVCDKLARGMQVKEIADVMHRSPYTIDTHIKNVKRKNALGNMADIVREFILSLDNPKCYFKSVVAIAFLSIQGFTITSTDVDEYRVLRTGRRTVRVSRTARKN